MPDHLDRKITRLAPGPVSSAQRFRVETRIVDSETQQTTLRDYRHGQGDGAILFAFSTNVRLEPDERRRIVQQIADLLIEARQVNGDEPS